MWGGLCCSPHHPRREGMFLAFRRWPYLLSPHDPFWTLVEIYFPLHRGITAAVEITPVKGSIALASLFFFIQKGAPNGPAANAAASARFTVGPLGVDPYGRTIGSTHGRRGPRERRNRSSAKKQVKKVIRVEGHGHSKAKILPKPIVAEKPVAEKGGQDKTTHNRCYRKTGAENKEKPGCSPSQFPEIRIRRGFEPDYISNLGFDEVHGFSFVLVNGNGQDIGSAEPPCNRTAKAIWDKSSDSDALVIQRERPSALF